MTETSLISIVLPVYNGEKYLEEAIISCLNQTYTNFELIVVDDASTDNSPKIAEDFRIKDSRIKILVNQKNLSLPRSLNVGHDHAKGDYITWTSDDNILKPDFLFNLYSTITNNECDVAYSNFDVIWEDGSFKREHISGPIAGMLLGNIIGPSFLYKREVYNEINGYDENLFLAEDYNFFLLASLNYKFTHLNKNIYKYRIHPSSLSGNIQSKPDYNSMHTEAISSMFSKIGSQLNMNVMTINFLVDLYLNRSISLKEYLSNKGIIKKDFIKYQNSLKTSENNECIFIQLREKMRANWVSNNKELNINNLFQVVFKDRKLLFGKEIKLSRTGSIIYKCLIH